MVSLATFTSRPSKVRFRHESLSKDVFSEPIATVDCSELVDLGHGCAQGRRGSVGT